MDMVLVVLIGGAPIAMPLVLRVSTEEGLREISGDNAIVTRFGGVEDTAAMDVLCLDRTRMLSLKRLSVEDAVAVAQGLTSGDIVDAAALASRRRGDLDAVDRAVVDKCGTGPAAALAERFVQLTYVPFSQSNRRAEATLLNLQTQAKFVVTKGAPQTIINLAHNADAIREAQTKILSAYASRGLRVIAIARCDDPDASPRSYALLGFVALSTYARSEAKHVLRTFAGLGIRPVIITSDPVAVGLETTRELGVGLNVRSIVGLSLWSNKDSPDAHLVEEAHVWCDVEARTKYDIVQALRLNGHVVGATGNRGCDAPSLKCAHVGIADYSASDLVIEAADIVLLCEGPSGIVSAVVGARRAVQRMRGCVVYACTTAVHTVTTFGVLAMGWQFTMPPFLVLMLALLNVGISVALTSDRSDFKSVLYVISTNVACSPCPDKLVNFAMTATALGLGLYLSASSIVFYHLILDTGWVYNKFACAASYNVSNPVDADSKMVNGILFLQVSASGQLAVLSARAHGWFWTRPPSGPLRGTIVVTQLAAILIAVYADWPFSQLYPIGWSWAGVVWVWSLVWSLPLDVLKFTVGFVAGSECVMRAVRRVEATWVLWNERRRQRLRARENAKWVKADAFKNYPWSYGR